MKKSVNQKGDSVYEIFLDTAIVEDTRLYNFYK